MPNKLNKTQIESIETSQVEQLSETLADNLQAANDYTDDEINTLSGSIATSLSGKEPTIIAGTTSQYWRGDKSFQTLNSLAVTENTNLYFTEARVRSTVLTGFSATNSAIVAGDSVLTAFNKTQGQINQRVSLTGNETIAGEKTFSSNPISSATQSTAINSLTRRDFVTGLDSQNVKTTGDQTIAGNKTFSSPVVGVAPTTGSHFTTRDFVRQENPNSTLISQYQTRVTSGGGTIDNTKTSILNQELDNNLRRYRKYPELIMDAEASSFPESVNVISGGSVNSNVLIQTDSGNNLYANTRIQTDLGLKFVGIQNWGDRRYNTQIDDANLNLGFILRGWFHPTQIGFVFGFFSPNNTSFDLRKFDIISINEALRFRLGEDGVNTNHFGRITANNTLTINQWQMLTFSFRPSPTNVNADLSIFRNGVKVDNADSSSGSPANITSTGLGQIILVASRGAFNSNLVGQFDLIEIIKGRSTTADQELAIFNETRSRFGV